MSADTIARVMSELDEPKTDLTVSDLKGMTADDRFFIAFIALYKINQREYTFRKFLILALLSTVAAVTGFQVFSP